MNCWQRKGAQELVNTMYHGSYRASSWRNGATTAYRCHVSMPPFPLRVSFEPVTT